MSLKPLPIAPIPESTRSMVQAKLPGADIYRIIGDRLSDFVCDADFADLYHAEGQPGISPALLGMVTIFQFMENLSDRQAARAVVMRLDWMYALRRSVSDPGFHYSVLSEFRTRVLKNDASIRPFAKLLAKLQDEQLVSDRGRQRTDGFAVIAAVRTLARLELVMETLRLALRALEQVNAEWLWSRMPQEWVEQYGEWAQEERLIRERGEKGRERAKKMGKQTGEDGLRLLAALDSDGAPEGLRELPEVIVLRQVWEQQYEVREGEYQWREKMVVPSAEVIQTPHDPQARLSRHGEQKWIGYQAQITETVAEDKPRIITDIQTPAATTHDAQMIAPIQEALKERGLLPKQQVVDTNYVSAQTLAQSEGNGVELVGPARGNINAQARMEDGLPLSRFAIDWKAKQVQCPCGKISVSWTVREGEDGPPEVHVHFAAADCRACPRHTQCITGKGSGLRGRDLYFHPRHDLLEQRRQEQTTDAFKEIYRSRAGVEATGSEMIRAHGLREARYVGQEKVSLQHRMMAAATNLKRAARWLAGERREPLRAGSLQGLTTSPA